MDDPMAYATAETLLRRAEKAEAEVERLREENRALREMLSVQAAIRLQAAFDEAEHG